MCVCRLWPIACVTSSAKSRNVVLKRLNSFCNFFLIEKRQLILHTSLQSFRLTCVLKCHNNIFNIFTIRLYIKSAYLQTNIKIPFLDKSVFQLKWLQVLVRPRVEWHCSCSATEVTTCCSDLDWRWQLTASSVLLESAAVQSHSWPKWTWHKRRSLCPGWSTLFLGWWPVLEWSPGGSSPPGGVSPEPAVSPGPSYPDSSTRCSCTCCHCPCPGRHWPSQCRSRPPVGCRQEVRSWK